MDEQGRIIDNSIIGKGVVIKPFVHIKNSIIRNGCLIESFSNIHGAKLGENVKVMGHVFIPAGIGIGRDTFIGPGTIFTNKKYPRRYGFKKEVVENRVTEEWVTIVEDEVTIGAGAIIGSGITIGKGSYIGMGSVVLDDVPEGALVYGVPAKRRDIDERGAPIRRKEDEPNRKWQNWNSDEIVNCLEKDWGENLIQRKTLHRVLKDLKEKHDLKTLHDVGGGTAVSYPFLLGCGYDYRMSDITPEMVEKAKEKFPEINVEVKDILDLTEEDKTDVVLSQDVLLHVPSPIQPYLATMWWATGKVLVLKLAYVWKSLDQPTRDDWDLKFYNRKFNLLDLIRSLLFLDPKKIEMIAVDDDEKTTPEWSNYQIFLIWKEEP